MFSREGQWVPLPDVQALGIAQHGARFKELREELEPQGYRIENKMEHGTDGIVRSWYMLTRSARISSFSVGNPLKSWSKFAPSAKKDARDCAVFRVDAMNLGQLYPRMYVGVTAGCSTDATMNG